MVAKSTLEVCGGTRKLVLAPFAKEHIAPHLPVPLSLLDHQPLYALPYYVAPLPEDLLRIETALSLTETWGIFVPELARQPLSADTFVGLVSASYTEDRQGSLSPWRRELGINLFRTEFTGKGIGSLAQAALAKHLLQRDASMVYAKTSPYNAAEQGALAKAGFVRIGLTNRPYEFSNGARAPMQQWWVMGDVALAGYADSPHYDRLAAGRQAFLAATAQVEVCEL